MPRIVLFFQIKIISTYLWFFWIKWTFLWWWIENEFGTLRVFLLAIICFWVVIRTLYIGALHIGISWDSSIMYFLIVVLVLITVWESHATVFWVWNTPLYASELVIHYLAVIFRFLGLANWYVFIRCRAGYLWKLLRLE